MVLYSETLDFIPRAIVATVAEIDCGSSLHDTRLATKVQKTLTKPALLHGVTPAETYFAASLHISLTIAYQFQRATAASPIKSPCCVACRKKTALSM